MITNPPNQPQKMIRDQEMDKNVTEKELDYFQSRVNGEF